MSDRYSPGPWTTDVTQRMRHDNTIPVRHANGRMVAYAADFNSYDRDDEVEANARLIAAAPELLEACLHLLARLDRVDPDKSDSPMRQFARAAIVKAGSEPLPTPEPEPLTDPMHQLANLDKPLSIGSLPATFAPTVLSQIMRERHAAGTCGWGCPECQAEREGQEAYEAACPEAEPIDQERLRDIWYLVYPPTDE